ncbi:MAG: cupredoxin domain-containing protein, partial [Actinomycetota bacterium]
PTPVEAEAPAPAEAAPAAVAAPAEAAPPRPAGVTHGTATGTRLRPEDAVTTEAQFTGQQAMYERRKLIDELVATGVPAVAAEDADRERSGWLAMLYLVIPLIVIVFLVAQSGDGEAPAEPTEQAGGGTGGGGLSISAESIQFNRDELTVPAGEEFTLSFQNNDTVPHNVAIYPGAEQIEGDQALFQGDIFTGPASRDYDVPAIEAGEYYFQCDVHPAMNGTVVAGQ